jgi:trigger factor
VKRQVLDLPEDEVQAQMERVAESARTYEAKKGKSEEGDRVTIDFVGKLDGTPFDGGAGEDQNLVLGSKTFIPGFEEQIVGLKAGDEKVITVTFPENYQAAHLAGKEATFDITVKEVSKPGKLEITDEVAKNLGLESAEKLREIVKSQLESQYGTLTRQKVKRELLDALDAQYSFEAPSKLVDAEFENIWNQVNQDLAQAGKTFADEDTTEEEAREEYQKLAERRVRLGLVLAEIGEQAKIQITDEEMQRALFEFVRRYPGQEQEVYDFYRNNPTALANLRAPLFEEKVVDHLLTQVNVDRRQGVEGRTAGRRRGRRGRKEAGQEGRQGQEGRRRRSG